MGADWSCYRRPKYRSIVKICAGPLFPPDTHVTLARTPPVTDLGERNAIDLLISKYNGTQLLIYAVHGEGVNQLHHRLRFGPAIQELRHALFDHFDGDIYCPDTWSTGHSTLGLPTDMALQRGPIAESAARRGELVWAFTGRHVIFRN
jgi:hypothetical protein